jgi:hypothetical protein
MTINRVWASTEWDRTFIFAADDDGGLMIVLEEPEAILKHGKDVLPAGDSQIQYYHNENRKTADPCYHIHRQVPDNIFRDVLRKMQDLFHDQWVNITCCWIVQYLPIISLRHSILRVMMHIKLRKRASAILAISSLISIACS